MVKIPTIVKYDKDDVNKFQWGARLKSSADNIVGIKLLLDPSQKLPWHVPLETEATLRLLPPSKTPQDVAADFLRAMKSHAMSQIENRMTQAVLNSFETEYVMSGADKIQPTWKANAYEEISTCGVVRCRQKFDPRGAVPLLR